MSQFKSEEDLKPCPFCGYEFPLYCGEKNDLSDFRVECSSCGMRSQHPDSINETITRWNCRIYVKSENLDE